MRTGTARHGRTRCSRTTPSSGWGFASRPTATTSSPAADCRSCATPVGPSWWTRSCPRRRCGESELRAQRERIAALAAPARRAGRSRGRGPAQRPRPPDPPQRVDRRRRWLGLRHRLGRARSRAGQRQERQRAGDGHRGVLQHRRADVQGDAARGGARSSPPRARRVPTKDLALQAIAYADVYVARVAFGADPQQTLRAFREAEAYEGPSLIIAYSHCVAHGYDMRDGLGQQYGAVASGHWPLIRYDPVARRGRQQSVPARLAQAADVAGGLPQGRAALSCPGRR